LRPIALGPCATLVSVVPKSAHAVDGRMKFAKHCNEVCLKLQDRTNVPMFPYRELKKQLKRSEQESEDPRVDFLTILISKLKAVDQDWERAVHAALRERTAMRSALLSSLGMISAKDEMVRKQCLAEWAAIARTGLRKIKKKYNKKLAARCGPADEFPGIDSFAFLRSRERTEIDIFAASSDSSSNEYECPVCLETLTQPVAPPCGHAMCSVCFRDLHGKREGVRRVQANGVVVIIKPKGSVPQCPVCRFPATDARRMPALARAAATVSA